MYLNEEEQKELDNNTKFYKVFMNIGDLPYDQLIRKTLESKKGFYHEVEVVEKKEVTHKGPFGLIKQTKINKGFFPIIVKKEGNTVRDILTNREYEELNEESISDNLKVYLVVPMTLEEVLNEVGKLDRDDINRYINVMEEIVKSNKEAMKTNVRKLSL